MRHDSHVRSDWYPAGLKRAEAIKVSAEAWEALQAVAQYHGGGSYGSADSISATKPIDWRDTYASPYTVKVRGCDAFRAEARRVLDSLIGGAEEATRIAPSAPVTSPVCRCGKTVLTAGVTCPRDC